MNFCNYKNDEVDALIEECLATLDDDERLEAVQRGQKMHHGRGALGLHRQSRIPRWRTKKDIDGITYYMSNSLRFQDFKRV